MTHIDLSARLAFAITRLKRAQLSIFKSCIFIQLCIFTLWKVKNCCH